MQIDAQSRQQPAHLYRPGVSGNPSGLSRTETRYREFLALYIETHGRRPNAVENAMLRNAGACAARAEDKRRAKVEHIVRCGRLLQQLLNVLGLAGAPSKGDGKAFPDHGLQGGSP
jgi:hypothetical protein